MAHETQGLSDRRRATLWLSKTILRVLDQGYKDAAHELYPLEISKADYLETCLKFALAHKDEIRIQVARSVEDHEKH